MELIVTTYGGTEFRGATPAKVVKAMKDTQWEAPDRKGEYMDEVRSRVAGMTEAPIHTDSPEAFLDSLEAAGLVTVARVDGDPSRGAVGSGV